MTSRNNQAMGGRSSGNRFVLLLLVLIVLLIAYPYFPDNQLGAFLGALMSLILLVSGVYAVRMNKRTHIVASILAFLAGSASVMALARGTRGHPLVESAFFLFQAFTTVVIFLEVIKAKQVTKETIYGIVCVYLLIGVTFGTLYDLNETLQPGSFQINVSVEGKDSIRWRDMIFFSFMTLTTIGYGDITPVTTQAQSLALIEGVIGVLYVAVLVARMVGIYSQTDGNFDD